MRIMKRINNYIKPYLQAIPSFFSYQVVSKLILVLATMIFTRLAYIFLEATGRIAITSGDFKFLFTTWQGIIILSIGIVSLIVYVVFDCVAKIIVSEEIINPKGKNIWRIMKESIINIPKFFNLVGVLIVLFIAFLIPLVGFGISISLTKNFKIPNFITSVIYATPVYLVLYIIGLIIISYIAFTHLFTLHFIVIKGLKPKEANKESTKLMKNNKKKTIKKYFSFAISMILIEILSVIIFSFVPLIIISLIKMGTNAARFVNIFVCLNSVVVISVVNLLLLPLQVLELTRIFNSLNNDENVKIPLKRKLKKGWLIRRIIAILILVTIISVLLFATFDYVFPKERNIWIIAHRGGGTLDVENSIEGLNKAIEQGVYGSEIDVQRTKDGRYIINHDSTFKRLAGIDKTAQEMTLEEIKNLEIEDKYGKAAVATLEEMLDTAKGKIKLFIELKGDSADEKMANDVIQIVKERDMLDECIFISLSYDLIDYIETTHPEATTGYLYYFSFGKVTGLNCDYLILEEQPATADMIIQIKSSGKKAIVWTVDSDNSLYRFLDSNVDGIITNEVKNAKTTQERLDSRTDVERIRDFFFIND